MATTFKDGDPSYAGALGGVALGLASFHILELKAEIPAEVWDRDMAFKELEMGDKLIEEVCATMQDVRGE